MAGSSPMEIAEAEGMDKDWRSLWEELSGLHDAVAELRGGRQLQRMQREQHKPRGCATPVDKVATMPESRDCPARAVAPRTANWAARMEVLIMRLVQEVRIHGEELPVPSKAGCWSTGTRKTYGAGAIAAEQYVVQNCWTDVNKVCGHCARKGHLARGTAAGAATCKHCPKPKDRTTFGGGVRVHGRAPDPWKTAKSELEGGLRWDGRPAQLLVDNGAAVTLVHQRKLRRRDRWY